MKKVMVGQRGNAAATSHRRQTSHRTSLQCNAGCRGLKYSVLDSSPWWNFLILYIANTPQNFFVMQFKSCNIFSLVFVTIMKYFDFVHCKYAAMQCGGSPIFNSVFVNTILYTPKLFIFMTTSNMTPACLKFYCPFMIPDRNSVSGEILPKCDVHQNPPVHNPQQHLGWKLQVWPCQLSSSSPPR